jgi:hypothetical protein
MCCNERPTVCVVITEATVCVVIRGYCMCYN